MALTGDKGKKKRQGDGEGKESRSNTAAARGRRGELAAEHRVAGSGRGSETQQLRAGARRGPPSPARSPPSATHLPSRPAPRPPRGSSPGAALPGGRRPRSEDPRRGRPRAPARPRRTRRRWRWRLLLLLPPASPSWPAGGRRARGTARPFSARRRQRRGSRGPGCGRGAG